MGVRPLDGLVAIAEGASRFEADAAVARLAANGIEAMVLADPAAGIAPHLVTDRRFPVVVRIAIADDAQQVLARSGFPTGVRDPSPLVHPVLRPRPRPTRPPEAPDPAGPVDGRHGSPDATDRFGPAGASPSWAEGDDLAAYGDDEEDDNEEDDDDHGNGNDRRRRPRWVKPVAWLTAASVVLPLVASAVRALSLL